MNVQVYYNKSKGIAEVCVSLMRRTIDIDSIEVYSVIPETVECKRGIDPTDTIDVPFADLDNELQDEVIEQAIFDYCDKQGNTVTEYHTHN